MRPSLDELKARERDAWDHYAQTCFHPLQQDNRARDFKSAMVAFGEVQAREFAMLADALTKGSKA